MALCSRLHIDLLSRGCDDDSEERGGAGHEEDMMAPNRPLVLVVEDEPAMRDMLQRMLERAGYGVECATDGVAGLARLEAGDVDLVLLDLMLPQLDGLEFCRQVRARQQERYLPIIMVTGSVNAADRRAGFAVGADDYVLKPFRTQALIDRVRAWTSRSSSRATVPDHPEEQP
jgi:DNA-binding response OmpR family regulator